MVAKIYQFALQQKLHPAYFVVALEDETLILTLIINLLLMPNTVLHPSNQYCNLTCNLSWTHSFLPSPADGAFFIGNLPVQAEKMTYVLNVADSP